MNETNRIAAIFLALLLMFVALLVILLAWGAPDESIERIADLAGFLDDHNTTATQLLITFAGLIFVLIGVTIIIAELAPPQTGSVRVAKVGAGEARIGTDEIKNVLEQELRAVPRLRGLEATVSSRGARANVKLDLFVDTQADVASTANDAIQRVRDVVETRMGVELDAPPRAEVHYSEQSGDKHQIAQPARTPSWQPVASPPSSLKTSHPTNDQPAPAGTMHEAAPTVSEDRPTGA
jgi:hypothetical protein